MLDSGKVWGKVPESDVDSGRVWKKAPKSDARFWQSLDEGTGKRCSILAEFGGRCRKTMLGVCCRKPQQHLRNDCCGVACVCGLLPTSA